MTIDVASVLHAGVDALTIVRIIQPFYGELLPPGLAHDCAAHAAMSLDSTLRSVEEDGTAHRLLGHGITRARLPHVWAKAGVPDAPTFTDAEVADVARRAYAALAAAGYDDVSGPSVRQSGKRLALPKGRSEPPSRPRGTPRSR